MDIIKILEKMQKEGVVFQTLKNFKLPGRNDACPCNSGKRFKLCCIRKSKNEIYLLTKGNEIILTISKNLNNIPDDAYITFNQDLKLFSISSTYGSYNTKKWGLYLRNMNQDLPCKRFIDVINSLEQFIGFNNIVRYSSNEIVDDKGDLKEFEFLAYAFKKKYVLQALKRVLPMDYDSLEIEYALLTALARIMHDFLESKGITSTFPCRITEEMLKSGNIPDMNKDIIIEIKSADKIKINSNYVKSSLAVCESPIEELLCKKLIGNYIPFLQQVVITHDGKLYLKNAPKQNRLTVPDFFIPFPSNMVAIYCDGHEFHNKTAAQVTRDRRIDRTLQSWNLRVLRFTAKEIYNNINRCIEEIKETYLGVELTTKPNDLIVRKMLRINPVILNKIQIQLYNSFWEQLKNNTPFTIMQEQSIQWMVDKTKRKEKSARILDLILNSFSQLKKEGFVEASTRLVRENISKLKGWIPTSNKIASVLKDLSSKGFISEVSGKSPKLYNLEDNLNRNEILEKIFPISKEKYEEVIQLAKQVDYGKKKELHP